VGVNEDFDFDSPQRIVNKPHFKQLTSNYLDRIILLNLKGNYLSDLSCKIVSSIVETSPALRMLDLRSNFISSNGAKLLFESIRKNRTVLYVTQRQEGFMLEGHREIQHEKAANGTDQFYSNKIGKFISIYMHAI
jgi:hypothetical protein